MSAFIRSGDVALVQSPINSISLTKGGGEYFEDTSSPKLPEEGIV